METSKDFKQFYQDKGPFVYALTSMDFPPVLLAPEEWIFSNDITLLLKELMQFDQHKMKVVQSPFNLENTSILRPDQLSFWKIRHFPEQWDVIDCDLFVPQGHLKLDLFDRIGEDPEKMDPQSVEQAFFQELKICLDQMGYLLLSPKDTSKYAAIHAYLREWEADEQEAGLL